MSLFQTIKKDQVEARKAKDTIKASLLTTLIGEIQGSITGGKAPVQYEEDGVTIKVNDNDTIRLINKFVKNTEDFLSVKPDSEELQKELIILKNYLPQKLSETELRTIISEVLKTIPDGTNSNAALGMIMKYLKQHHENLYDAKLVKDIFLNK